MIVGGTADFSIHEVEENGSLTELYRASGGPYGGMYVDQEYLKIYNLLFGEGTIEQLKHDDMIEYLTITREFETKKRTVSKSQGCQFITRLSPVLNQKYSDEEKKRIIESSCLKGHVSIFKDKLKLSHELLEGFFKDSLDNIVKHVQTILKHTKNIDTILLVGGYSESPMLQETFRSEFKGKQIIIPQDCNLAVMKGAVLFGFNPQHISARILRYSYGVECEKRFDSNKHPEERRYTDKEGVERCKQVFSQIIAKDTKVPSTGKAVTRIGHPLFKNQMHFTLRIYFTDKDNPIVVDESFQQLGTLHVAAPDHIKEKWKAEEVFVFGLTEIKVSANIKGTDSTFETILDLLE